MVETPILLVETPNGISTGRNSNWKFYTKFRLVETPPVEFQILPDWSFYQGQ